jgi:outer membrane protein with beta-barrel domain
MQRWFLAIVMSGLAVTPVFGQQTEDLASRVVLDFGVGFDPSINGNVNSGAIGVLRGQATAILPQPYGDIYGTTLGWYVGGGYVVNHETEVRAGFTWQSADADLVHMGDIGPSSLYGQYSDYKSFGLDVGLRRYFLQSKTFRPYGEASIGLAWIDRIDVLLAAPRANLTFDNTDFLDATAAFTWNLSFGALVPISDRVDAGLQLGLRHVGGMSPVDQFVGTGLEDINNDTARLSFPIRVTVRVRFK